GFADQFHEHKLVGEWDQRLFSAISCSVVCRLKISSNLLSVRSGSNLGSYLNIAFTNLMERAFSMYSNAVSLSPTLAYSPASSYIVRRLPSPEFIISLASCTPSSRRPDAPYTDARRIFA